MKTVLLDLALRGTLVSLIVLLLEAGLSRRQSPHGRRLWWVLVGLAWILPFHLPHSASIPQLSMPFLFDPAPTTSGARSTTIINAPVNTHRDGAGLLVSLWLGGAAVSFVLLCLRTWRTSRRWSRVRLSTDQPLLDLLEDCKATAGVRAPIGLIVTSNVSTPALLGWLRPRILLPETLVTSVRKEELRGILLHELAHFRSADIPLHWLFCLGYSLHWFNPLAHLATRRWIQFRELAADASAIAWMPATHRHAYGDALVAAIRQANPLPIPRGALALGESFQQLKHRITMIASTEHRARLVWLAGFVSLVLSAVILLPRAAFAQSTTTQNPGNLAADITKKETDERKLTAVAQQKLIDEVKAVAEPWLKLIDERKYAESWDLFNTTTKSVLTAQSWAGELNSARQPLGKLKARSLLTSEYQTEFRQPDGGTSRGEFVIQSYKSSFENFDGVRETVIFMKDLDGQWRAAGYYIKSR